MQFCLLVLFASTVAGAVEQLQAAEEQPGLSLWPMPYASKILGAACLRISADTFTIRTEGNNGSAILQAAIERTTATMFLGGAPQQPCTSARGVGASAVAELAVVVQSSDETLGPKTAENYTLSITAPQARLTAPTVYGALRGLQTFSQLTFGGGGVGYGGTSRTGARGSAAAAAAAANPTRFLPSALIVDKPRYGYRALMIDTARLFRPVALLEAMMDAMEAAKMNALYLHLTDDGCWPVEILSYPLLATNCSKGCVILNGSSTTGHQFYSQSDIRRLVNYGLLRGIRIIPEIDSPGHFDTQACYPNLLTVADYPCPGAGPGKGTFTGPPDPSNPELWAFFKSVYAELATLFPDPYVSLGGDEAWLTPWSCSPVRRYQSLSGFHRESAQERSKSPPPLATDNLLENTGGVLHHCSPGAVSLLPYVYADVRCIDAVVVSQTVSKWMAANNLKDLGAAATWYEQHLFAVVNSTASERGAGFATKGAAAAASTQHRKQTMMWAPGEQAVDNSTIHIVWTGWPVEIPLATYNLLENTDWLPQGSEHPMSVLSGRHPATFCVC